MNCDEYGWCKFMPTDEVKPFDGSIDTGLYFVSTTHYRPLRGNGWYVDDTVDKALKHSLMSETDIIYQIKTVVGFEAWQVQTVCVRCASES